jgi:predicted acyl esterase
MSSEVREGASSEVRDGMRVEWDVPIEMDDGVVLRADVFRPDADGRYPVLLSYGPYAKGLHFEDGYADQWRIMCEKHPDVPAGSTNKYQSWEIADPEKWVPHDYALVRVDSRGAGRSPGVIDCFSDREAQDLYLCVEWSGTQPWSSGKVGLSGISYYAVNQWQVAAKRPPHLAAICPWEGFADHYRDLGRHGGILSTFGENWYPAQVETVQHGLGARGQRSRVTGELVAGDETLSAEQLEAQRVDYGHKMLQHTLDDEHYRERTPDLTMIDVPLLSAGNWGGHGLHLRGNVEGYVQASSEHKWLEIHGLEHWIHYYTDYGRELQLAFFDRFLHGRDNGWDEQAPVILNVRHVDGTFVRRDEEAWPIPRTQWTRLYLDAAGGRLSRTPPAEPAQATYAPLDGELAFVLEIEEDTEITGPMAAKLFVSTESEDADLFLVVRVFDPDGQEVTFQGALEPHSPFAHGWLRLSHRALDAERSTAYRPYHPHTEVEPAVPGEVHEVDVEIWPSCLVVPAGYRLELTVQGRDYRFSDEVERVSWFTMTGVGPFKHDHPADRPAAKFGAPVTLHTGGSDHAYLLVPVIPQR